MKEIERTLATADPQFASMWEKMKVEMELKRDETERRINTLPEGKFTRNTVFSKASVILSIQYGVPLYRF